MGSKTTVLTAVAAAMLLSTAAVLGVGEREVVKIVSSEAKWAARVDLRGLRDTEIGERITKHLEKEDIAKKINAFAAIADFDPRTDIDDIVIYGFGRGKRDGVIVARGDLNMSRLENLVILNETHKSEEYGTRVIHSWIDKNQPLFACAATPDTVVFTDGMENMRLALDVLDGRASSQQDKASLPGIESAGGKVFFAAVAKPGDMPALRPQAAMLQNAELLSLAIGEDKGNLEVAVGVLAVSAEAANNMAKMAEGMLGLAALNAGTRPMAAALAQKVKVVQNGLNVNLSMSMPSAEIAEMIEAAIGKQQP